jgi:hypothetical protein
MPSNLLTSHFRTVFEDILTPFQQLQAINSLKDYILELQHGTDDQRRELDIIGEDDVDSVLVHRKVNAALERCYWQLVMFLRVSVLFHRLRDASGICRAQGLIHFCDSHHGLHVLRRLSLTSVCS